MNNQDINTEFSSFIQDFTRSNPNKRLSEIAERRGIELGKLDASSLSNPEADYKAMSVWRQAKDDLKQLIDPMSSTLWNLAFKYFKDDIEGIDGEEDKKEAISDLCGLPENRIDAENELKEIVKEKICETSFTINGNTLTLFSEDDAQSKTPEELCEDIDERVSEMSAIIDQDAQDRSVYNDVQKNHTFEDFFRALAAFLNMKLGKILKKGNMNIYNFSYDENTECLVGRHISTGIDVITVTPDIEDEDDTGSISDLICDIDVAGLGLPDSHPLYTDTKDMAEVIDYITRHRRYSPGKNGQYTIPGVRGSDVPALVYNAVQEWQATATACHQSAIAYSNATTLLGKENLGKLQDELSKTATEKSLGNSKGYSSIMPEYHKKISDEMEERAKFLEPKIDDNGNFTDEDFSKALQKVHIALNGKDANGNYLTDEEKDAANALTPEEIDLWFGGDNKNEDDRV